MSVEPARFPVFTLKIRSLHLFIHWQLLNTVNIKFYIKIQLHLSICCHVFSKHKLWNMTHTLRGQIQTWLVSVRPWSSERIREEIQKCLSSEPIAELYSLHAWRPHQGRASDQTRMFTLRYTYLHIWETLSNLDRS